jgi:hypothetical protein
MVVLMPSSYHREWYWNRTATESTLDAMAPRVNVEVAETERAASTAAADVVASLSGAAREAERILALQRAAGNRAVAGLLHGRRVLARDTWAKEYKTRRSRQGLTYEQYKAAIGTAEAEKYAPAIKAASQWGGTKLPTVALSRPELGEIVKSEGGDAAARAGHEKRLDDYLPYINNAFEAMGLDTVESQASFLAHAAESGSFAALTEKEDPKVPREYGPFIGRGPVQVTWETGYVQALAYVEARGEQLTAEANEREKQAPGSPEVKRLRELAALASRAVAAIKADIKQAANPEYAFLFSTALMHVTKGLKRSASLKGIQSPAFAGHGAEDQWVTNFTESFQDTLDKAPARKAAAQARLKEAEARLAADPADEVAKKDIQAAKNAIRLQEGAIRDMPSALRGAKIKKSIYERAHKVLTEKAKAGAAASPAATQPAAPAAGGAATAPPVEDQTERLKRIANRALGQLPGFSSSAHQLIWELVHAYAPEKGGRLGGSQPDVGVKGFQLGPKATVVMGHDVVRRVAEGHLAEVGAELRRVLEAVH